jgi:hypothetical protein
MLTGISYWGLVTYDKGRQQETPVYTGALADAG